MLVGHPTKGQRKRTRPELIVRLERLPSVIKIENDTEYFIEEENDTFLIEETHTEVNISLKKHSFTAESTTVKRCLDDCDNRKPANEIDHDLDRKLTIKSEEENSIYNQYWVSHEELDIKSEGDEEQPDTLVADHSTLKNDVLVPRCPGRVKKGQIKIHKCPDRPSKLKHKRIVKQNAVRQKKTVWHHCTECSYKTNWRRNLKQHAIVHNKTKHLVIFQCAHCVYETPRKHNLKAHLLVVHRGGESLEPDRPHKTDIKTNRRLYSRGHSNKELFKCTQCLYQAKRRICLTWHQLKHESIDKWHACPHCPYKTIRKYNLQLHVRRTHTNPDQLEWYVCEQCPYKTNAKSRLNEHVFIHNRDHANWLRCTTCSFKTLKKYRLRQHQMKHHKDDDDDPEWQKCSECPYKAIRKGHLLAHAQHHKAADQTDWFQCPECSYRTSRLQHVKMHRHLHNAFVEWFHCFDCPYKTTWKTSLMYHVKIHRHTGQDKLT